jgi:glycosyltransferase involved in cell wall biosynthesis
MADVAPHRGGICFVAPNAYPILAGDRKIRFAGGAEVQQSLLAREFAARGYRVAMVSLDFGQPACVMIDGVEVIRACAPDAGIPVLRFIHPRLTSLWRAMKCADADLYYQRSAGALTGMVVAFARAHRRACVYAAASDADFDESPRFIPYLRDRLLFRWGVRNATAVAVQNAAQLAACRRVHSRAASLIGNCHPPRDASAEHAGHVLWAGSVRQHKRPLEVVSCAERCPDLRFRMVGDGDADLMAALRSAAARLTNLEVIGFVPFAEVDQHFDGAFALLNTSPAEGFPNTFLQAWARGVPTVSYVGPGVQFDGRQIGKTCDSVEASARQLHRWRAMPEEWRSAGADARRYVALHAGVGGAASAYESLFLDIAPAMMKSKRIPQGVA